MSTRNLRVRHDDAVAVAPDLQVVRDVNLAEGSVRFANSDAVPGHLVHLPPQRPVRVINTSGVVMVADATVYIHKLGRFVNRCASIRPDGHFIRRALRLLAGRLSRR